MDSQDSRVELSKEWQILGPFQIGTREATWGADPLEYQGGFRSLEYDPKSTFPSSISPNGTVSWKTVSAEKKDSESGCRDHAIIRIRFPEIDWASLQSVFGWSALQYQGWARGEIAIKGDREETIVLYTDQILEFWLDDELHFGGDLYSFRRAPLVVHLKPGPHRLDLRLIRDARAMGGTGEPEIDVEVEALVASKRLPVHIDQVLLPELVNDTVISKHVSIPLRNDGQSWAYIHKVEAWTSHSSLICWRVTPSEPTFAIAPGQSRPLSCEIVWSDRTAQTISFEIAYSMEGDDEIRKASGTSQLSRRGLHEPQRITFMGPGGAASYAILRPPSHDSSSVNQNIQSLPILVNLHGAGLDADSEEVRHTLDAASDLPVWTIFPTGGSLWSGDDWHTMGFSNVQAAIAAIPAWVDAMSWRGPGPNFDEVFFSGHSNGGQGTWFAASHHPDLAIAAAPVSGYSSIQTYVSYNMWHEMDPRIGSLLGASLLSYRHELLVPNLAGIPILQQHGDADDNVPVFHSRRLSQLLSQNNGSSKYVELPGKGHWFDGVMTSKPLRQFYEDVLRTKSVKASLPLEFEFVVPNSGDLGSKGGIHVDQLISPDRVGRIRVSRREDTSSWVLKTSNILRFHFSLVESRQSWPDYITIDTMEPLHVDARTEQESQYFVRRLDRTWTTQADNSWKHIGQRRGAQLGALDAFLRSKDRFHIQAHNLESLKVPVQISRNLFQYFGADADISTPQQRGDCPRGNTIHVAMGFPAMPDVATPFPIDIRADEGIIIRDSRGQSTTYSLEAGLGAIFLMPLPDERLLLVVWGTDQAGLDRVARLIPVLTGTGQPDFIVCNRECAWKGAAGVLAAGLFDYGWEVSDASYLT